MEYKIIQTETCVRKNIIDVVNVFLSKLLCLQHNS